MSFAEKADRFEHRFSLQVWNVLHHACWNFHTPIAEYLLDNTRIDPLAKVKVGNNALGLALRCCQEGEAPDQGLPILELFHRKAPQALELSGKRGKELQSMPTLIVIPQGLRRRYVAFSGYRPIHVAAMNGHVRCLKRLLELGVDRDPRNEQGMTPLHLAALNNALDAVKVLVADGADLSAKDRYGMTAAQIAKVSGHTEVARYLVEQLVQRARIAAVAAAGPSSSQPAAPPAPRPALSPSVVLSGRRCHTCNKQQDEPRVSLGACAGCLCTFYCSAACQQLDWGRGHEAACLGRLRRFLEAARASGLEVAEDHPVARRAHAAGGS